MQPFTCLLDNLGGQLLGKLHNGGALGRIASHGLHFGEGLHGRHVSLGGDWLHGEEHGKHGLQLAVFFLQTLGTKMDASTEYWFGSSSD